MSETHANAASLRAEHAHLDERFVELCDRARIGTWHEVDELWPDFVADLEGHLAYEESELFPAFEQTPEGPDRTAELRHEHALIRALVEKVGVDVQLHVVRADTIDRLVAALRDHAAREERVFYPWLARRELARST
jgi:iron-sulfur cluster repair protein YtfE (RIC family)